MSKLPRKCSSTVPCTQSNKRPLTTPDLSLVRYSQPSALLSQLAQKMPAGPAPCPIHLRLSACIGPCPTWKNEGSSAMTGMSHLWVHFQARWHIPPPDTQNTRAVRVLRRMSHWIHGPTGLSASAVLIAGLLYMGCRPLASPPCLLHGLSCVRCAACRADAMAVCVQSCHTGTHGCNFRSSQLPACHHTLLARAAAPEAFGWRSRGRAAMGHPHTNKLDA